MELTRAMRASPFIVVCAAGLVFVATAVLFLDPSSSSTSERNSELRPVWTEVKWPFPIDQWGTGKAYVCRAADCGREVALYLRPKIGFCNCRGVDDDEELERVSDLELVGDRYSASGPSSPITISAMQGRSRPFAISNSSGFRGTALAIAFHDRCDLVVATAVFGHGSASELELAVARFLNTGPVLHWLERTLGL